MNWNRLLLTVALAALAVGCSSEPKSSRKKGKSPADRHTAIGERKPAAPGEKPDSAEVERGIRDAATYLKRHTDEDGRFEYVIHLEGRATPNEYNVLRHAGTLYALGQYLTHVPDDAEAKRTLLRAARYLRRLHLKPVKTEKGLSTIWSLPPEETRRRRKAKLGGAGLGLVGLVTARHHDPQIVPLEHLRRVGRFVKFMQLPSGKFRAKYDETVLFKGDFHSLYYPGEAVLGLVMLHEIDPKGPWIQIGAKAVSWLVTHRAKTNTLPPDHWLLIACQKLLPYYEKLDAPPLPTRDVVEHTISIGKSMMAEQTKAAKQRPEIAGSFFKDGRSTPTACRLEGLVALHDLLEGRDQEALRKKLRAQIELGVRFLLSCQVKEGPALGGFLHAHSKIPGKKSHNRYQAEIRVDYVQHALSALGGWSRINRKH